MNQQEYPVADTPDDGERAKAKLATDYGEIATLTELLNEQVTQFVQHMNGMVESIPSQDSLAEIFREHSMKYDADVSMENKQVSEMELRLSVLAEHEYNGPTL